jgi:hypothetical protein
MFGRGGVREAVAHVLEHDDVVALDCMCAFGCEHCIADAMESSVLPEGAVLLLPRLCYVLLASTTSEGNVCMRDVDVSFRSSLLMSSWWSA